MDADHYGWIFACLLLISPVLFLLVPSGTLGSSAFSRYNHAAQPGDLRNTTPPGAQPLASERGDPRTRSPV
jgi:hypothetical protein